MQMTTVGALAASAALCACSAAGPSGLCPRTASAPFVAAASVDDGPASTARTGRRPQYQWHW